MNMQPTKSLNRLRAFTVLEVLIAITIFSLVSVVIFSVFDAAIRSQNVGDRETKTLARGRYALDSLERDFGNLLFRDETSYNVNITAAVEEMERQRYIAEQTGDYDDFYSNYGDPADPDSIDEARIGNPYDRGRIIDLQFIGNNSGKLDDITFTIQQNLEVGTIFRPFGMAKVKYFVQKGQLIRSADTVEAAPRNQFGETFARPIPPDFTRLADNVKEFDVSYSYWYDNQWYEVDEWQSTMRTTRNGKQILGETLSRERDRDRDRDRNSDDGPIGELRPGDPGWNEWLNDQKSEPLDRLPALVRVRLTLGEPDTDARTVTLQRLYRVYPAEETYIPWQELTEELREEEREVRNQAFRLVFPGVMDKF